MNQPLKLLFLCTGNSCRSQMAEGWVNHLKSDLIDARSAGIETHGLNPLAAMVHYWRVRDEIRVFVESLPEWLQK